MADHSTDPDPNKINSPHDAAPDATQEAAPAESQTKEKSEADAAHHVEDLGATHSDSSSDMHKKAGKAVISQQHTIPTTGKRMPTSKWEYIFFCVFCKHSLVATCMLILTWS